jgi:hypothetical protein
MTVVAMAAAVCLRWHVRSCGVQRRDDFRYSPPALRRSTVPEKLILAQPAAKVDYGDAKYLSVTRGA